MTDEPFLCPECGAALPPDAPQTPCPVCLMKLGLESWSLRSAAGGAFASTEDTPSRTFDAPDPQELAGRFPNLEISELLGRGGMGAVYKARQISLDRLVALKVIAPSAAEAPDFEKRFTREAKALAKLSHPHVVTVYDFGVTDGLYYLLMEFVDGANVRQLMRDGRLEPRQALDIVAPICDALQFAHDEGIVHRDIKPENILIDRRGRVKIADFGLARLIRHDTAAESLTQSRQIMGTPRYMAPEQMEGSRDVDHRADIYSLGVVLYEMLTGELPLGRFAPPSRKVQVDVRLDDVVLKTLEKDPDRRYQHASDVKTAVQTVSDDAGRLPDLVATPPRDSSRWSHAIRGLQIAGVLTGIAAFVSLGVVNVPFRRIYAGGQEVIRYSWITDPPDSVMGDSGVGDARLLSQKLDVSLLTLQLAIVVFATLGFLGLLYLIERGIRRPPSGSRKSHTQASAVTQAEEQPSDLFSPGAGPQLMSIALAMVFSGLLCIVGITLMIGAIVWIPEGGSRWGFVGAGAGTLVGGLGGLFGTWRNYHLFRGKSDPMAAPDWTFFDWGFLWIAVSGLVAGGIGIAQQDLDTGARWTLLLLGLVAVALGGGFCLWRSAARRAARNPQTDRLDLRLLIVAAGLIIGALTMTGGLVILMYAVLNEPRWLGAGFGAFFGGGGALFGSWNSYRQMEGACDIWASTHRTWFDHFAVALLFVSLAAIATGIVAPLTWNSELRYALTLLGGIIAFQCAIVITIREFTIRGGRQQAEAALHKGA